MLTSRSNILGEIAPRDFLKSHWQKKPLLVRQALPGFESPLSADELAGLACEQGIESRLVEKVGNRWLLESGPFDAGRFAKLPKRGWTLLVQDVEKHLPEFAAHLDRFDFIPRWRIDDLMISHAVDGGSVGPHVDAYDVFLLQAKGRRRWRIAEQFDPEIVAGLDIRVLKHFDAEQEWTLEPGDMLYLPPNVAHEGVALGDDCQTWSIGFRAPSLRDMFSDFSEWLFQQLPEETMYADPDLAPWEAADGKISPSGLSRMHALLRDALNRDNSALDRWFGQFMTEPKPWLHPESSEDTPDAKTFAKRLRSGDDLLRDTRALLAWIPTENGTVLFVNGEAWEFAKGSEALLGRICTLRRLGHRDVELADENSLRILQRLHAAGAFHFASVLEADDD